MIYRCHHAQTPPRVRSKWPGHFSRVRVGKFWRAPKLDRGIKGSQLFILSSFRTKQAIPILAYREINRRISNQKHPGTGNAEFFDLLNSEGQTVLRQTWNSF